MTDKIRISVGFLACFCTNPEYGHLQVIDGKVVVNKPRAFNEARRVLHAGANTIRVLRHAPWANPVRFDSDCPGFWSTMREWLGILHQPYQGEARSQGADIVLELFDGCGRTGASNQTTLDKEWMYASHDHARAVIARAFQNLGDLSYVKFGCGNEMNQPGVVDFHRKVLFPAFKDAGRVPFSFGAAYSYKDDYIETVKGIADHFWEDRDKRIFRQIHGVRDYNSDSFKWFVENWMRHPIRVFLSGDGVKPRPTGVEFASVLQYLFDNAPVEFANPADTKLKFCIERMGGENAEAAIAEASEVYERKFGIHLVNFGQYPNDWVEPVQPEPPIQPPSPPEPPEEKPCSYFLKRLNIWHWLRCIFLGKH